MSRMVQLSTGAISNLRKKVRAPPLPRQIAETIIDLDSVYGDIPEYQVLKRIPGIEPFLEPRNLLIPDLIFMLQKSGVEGIEEAIVALGKRPVTDIVFVHKLQNLNRVTAEMELDSIKYVGDGVENPNIQCAKCESRLVSSRPVQNRSADEPPTYLCKCLNPKCKNKWSMRAA